jgi:hypothetical protein
MLEHCTLAHCTLAQRTCRARAARLAEVFGVGRVPRPLWRESGAGGGASNGAPWVPPSAGRGLFLDFVTMAQAERGAFESPAQKAQRIARAIILHLVDRVGGLPALAARMTPGAAGVAADSPACETPPALAGFATAFAAAPVGGSFGAFAEDIVRSTVRALWSRGALQAALAAIGEDALSAAEIAAVSATLKALSVTSDCPARTTPPFKRARCAGSSTCLPVSCSILRRARAAVQTVPASLLVRCRSTSTSAHLR